VEQTVHGGSDGWMRHRASGSAPEQPVPRKMSDEDDEATAAEQSPWLASAPDQSPWLASRVAAQVLGFLVVLLLGVFFFKKKNWILSSGCWVRSWFLATFLLFLASVGFQSGGGKWFSFHRHYS
jgi:hypothetical protein